MLLFTITIIIFNLCSLFINYSLILCMFDHNSTYCIHDWEEIESWQ